MERECISVMLRIVLLYTIISSVYCDCGPPPNIPNSRLKAEFYETTTFPIDFSVKYECHPGYTAKPGVKNTIRCLETSKWSPYEEFCTLKRCPYPGDIENGYFEAESFFFGSRTNYFCNAGYRINSKRSYRDCLADGTWSNALPYCEVAVCPPPPRIPHGSFYPEKDEYHYQDAVVYTCKDSNAVMEHDSSVFCTGNGTWSDTEPRCIVVDCPPPNVKNSKRVMGFQGPYRQNSLVKFECSKGFKMNGSDSILCTIDSIWHPPPPKCIKLFCPDPTPENGTIISGNKTDGSYDINDSITLGCEEGYRIRGQRNLTCGNDFQWKPEMPYCELGSYCPEPSLKNGIIASRFKPDGSYDVGDWITLKCNSGYNLKGTERLTCGPNFQWKETLPVCEKRSYCPQPSLENGVVASRFKPDGSYDVNDWITLGCHSGYKLKGTERLTCGPNFQWKETLPVCEKGLPESYCPAPRLINGYIKKGQISDGLYSKGSEVTMECDSGYELNNKGKMTCGEDLQWSPKFTICQLKNGCKAPVITNGRVSRKNKKAYNPEEDGYGFSDRDEIELTCDEGYKREGFGFLKCFKGQGILPWSSKYEWNADIPVCKK